MNRNLFLLLIGLLLNACEPTNRSRTFEAECICESSCPESTLTTIREIEIPVAGLPYDFPVSTWHVTPGSSQYWGYDPGRATLYVFDVDQADTIKTIPLPAEGTEAIPPIVGFAVHSPDSILLHTGRRGQLLLVDDYGRIRRRWLIPTGDLPEGIGRADLYYSTVWPPYNTSNLSYRAAADEVTLLLYHFGFATTHAAEKFMLPQFAKYDLAREQVTAVYGAFPDGYRNPEQSAYFSFTPFVTVAGATWASFGQSHCLYAFRSAADRWSVCSRSRYLPDRFAWLPSGLTPAERDPLQIRAPAYENFQYDPYRQLFYRIALHGLPETAEVGRDWTRRYQSPWSIMFLDQAGNCLGETRFPANRYRHDLVFPTPEGLVVGRENPYDPGNAEDVLQFTLFSLEARQ